MTGPSTKTSLEMSCSRRHGIINQVSNLTFEVSNKWRRATEGVVSIGGKLLLEVIMSRFNSSYFMSPPKRDFFSLYT
jgi:hypothetical protein